MSDIPKAPTDLDIQASLIAEANDRRRQMLLTAFGPIIEAALQDEAVIEVMVNPDGKLWIERVGEGRVDMDVLLQPAESERIIRLVAAHMRGEVHEGAPIVSAELPHTGERFEGILPPVAKAPCFAIRKPAFKIYGLIDYVEAHILSPLQAKALSEAVVAILIAPLHSERIAFTLGDDRPMARSLPSILSERNFSIRYSQRLLLKI